jgi:hypothetical protein
MMTKTNRIHRIKRIDTFAEILILLGGLLLVFSATITFKLHWPDELENIIYFRSILLGSVFLIIGSAIIVKNIFIQSALFSLGSGNVALIIMSIYNLLADDLIDLDKYFDWTILVVLVTLLILLFLRLWLNKILAFLGY